MKIDSKYYIVPAVVLLMAFLIISFYIQTKYSDDNIYSHHGEITPDMFSGSDTEKIQSAVDAAKGTTNMVVIPAKRTKNGNIWLLDSAILLPGNMTVILENCTIQLSDKCRDNMFRSGNVGVGITDPEFNSNISIIGVGEVVLKGAENPRATGDGARTLVSSLQNGRVSYGSDAGKEGVKQKGDWRNIMILMAYVDGFKLKNVTIENAHAWAISFERTHNADISDIRFNCPDKQIVDGKEVFIANRDGIDLRHGCKNFRIHNISGTTGDDFIALSILGLNAEVQDGGTLASTMVTSRRWKGTEDDTEQIYISDIQCNSLTRAVAIRANGPAGISNLYVDGLIFEGGYNAMLVGGKGYGDPSLPGKINNIYAMNIIGGGRSLIHIEEAIANCSFVGGVFKGNTGQEVTYNIEKSETENVIFENIMSTGKN